MGPLVRLPWAQSFLWRLFQEQKFNFFRLFIQIQKYLAKLNKSLNQCLDFSSLIDDFTSVKAQRHLFLIFNYILSNKKQKALQTFVSTKASSLVIQ